MDKDLSYETKNPNINPNISNSNNRISLSSTVSNQEKGKKFKKKINNALKENNKIKYQSENKEIENTEYSFSNKLNYDSNDVKYSVKNFNIKPFSLNSNYECDLLKNDLHDQTSIIKNFKLNSNINDEDKFEIKTDDLNYLKNKYFENLFNRCLEIKQLNTELNEEIEIYEKIVKNIEIKNKVDDVEYKLQKTLDLIENNNLINDILKDMQINNNCEYENNKNMNGEECICNQEECLKVKSSLILLNKSLNHK